MIKTGDILKNKEGVIIEIAQLNAMSLHDYSFHYFYLNKDFTRKHSDSQFGVLNKDLKAHGWFFVKKRKENPNEIEKLDFLQQNEKDYYA